MVRFGRQQVGAETNVTSGGAKWPRELSVVFFFPYDYKALHGLLLRLFEGQSSTCLPRHNRKEIVMLARTECN